MISKSHKTILFFLMAGTALFFGVVYFSFVYAQNTIPKAITGMVSNQPSGTKTVDVSAEHSLSTVKSNKWYSSVASFPSQALYAFPLAYKLTSDGLGFSFPKVNRTEKTIFAGYDEDFTIGFTSPITKSQVTHVGDWNVGLDLTSAGSKSLAFMLTQGVPSTVISVKGQDVVIKTKHAFTTYENSPEKEIKEDTFSIKSFLVKVKDAYYVFSFDQAYAVTKTKNTLTIPEVKTIFVGVLDDPAHIDTFIASAQSEITNTRVAYAVSEDELVSTYALSTTTGTPLIALFPHQVDFLSSDGEEIGTYDTLRGEMTLLRASNFTTSMPLDAPSATFPSLTKNQAEVKKQLTKDIADFIKEPVPESRNYFMGTWFGTANRLLLIAETLSMESEKKKLVTYITPIFKESLKYYSYDESKTSLIAKKPEFGNEKLNDHHFHYGYYIQTAAILSRMDPTIQATVQPVIDEMVSDIATTDRSSDKYPFLRNFEIYEGHSWADGEAKAPDGNNQESTSEAINTWYSLYLWSEMTKNTTLRDYALALYRTEIEAAKYYWFDSKGMYKAPYKHRIASIVWGGKVDFATWFSDKGNMIYGIQLLPFTPASDYLGTLPSFEPYEKDLLASGGSFSTEWANLIWMWKSYYEPVAIQDIPKNLKIEERSPLSILYYIISKNAE
ncbi:MAG: glycosyl hydrolase [Patescibacteria group bacterium]